MNLTSFDVKSDASQVHIDITYRQTEITTQDSMNVLRAYIG